MGSFRSTLASPTLGLGKWSVLINVSRKYSNRQTSSENLLLTLDVCGKGKSIKVGRTGWAGGPVFATLHFLNQGLHQLLASVTQLFPWIVIVLTALRYHSRGSQHFPSYSWLRANVSLSLVWYMGTWTFWAFLFNWRGNGSPTVRFNVQTISHELV